MPQRAQDNTTLQCCLAVLVVVVVLIILALFVLLVAIVFSASLRASPEISRSEVAEQFFETKQQREDIKQTAGFRSTTSNTLQRIQEELQELKRKTETVEKIRYELLGQVEDTDRLVKQVESLQWTVSMMFTVFVCIVVGCCMAAARKG